MLGVLPLVSQQDRCDLKIWCKNPSATQSRCNWSVFRCTDVLVSSFSYFYW